MARLEQMELTETIPIQQQTERMVKALARTLVVALETAVKTDRFMRLGIFI